MFGFIKKAVSDLFIASPQETAGLLLWRYPDASIPNGAKLTVRADEVAVFVREGRVIGVLDAGTHVLRTSHLKFLGDLVVSPLTGDNHFLTELFFIRRTEVIHQTGPRPLGTYTDRESNLLVGLGFVARYAIRATDPVAVLLRLTGLRGDLSATASAFLDGRLASSLAACVGALAREHPLSALVSNALGEQLGQFVLQQARAHFQGDGLELARFLELHLLLDDPSRAALAEYARKVAELNLQRKGAELASMPGFAQYHLVQGQRAMLEGLAKQGAVLPALAPVGLPAVIPVPSVAAPVEPASRPMTTGRTKLAAAPRWYVRTNRGIEGPYTARQTVTCALAEGIPPEELLVRTEDEDGWENATDIEPLAGELARRAGRPQPPSSVRASPTDSFERALSTAVADGHVSDDELAMLGSLAGALGLASDGAASVEYVRMRARALGAATTSAPDVPPPLPGLERQESPPLPGNELFTYSDGTLRIPAQPAAAIAERVRAAPAAVHLVWRAGMPAWVPARDVEAIRALLG